jgi:hypothetical protein
MIHYLVAIHCSFLLFTSFDKEGTFPSVHLYSLLLITGDALYIGGSTRIVRFNPIYSSVHEYVR